MTGNPWVDDKGDDFKKEVLIALDKLMIRRVNDMEEDFTEEERQEAKAEKAEREKARLEAEEEARRAAEEKENNPEAEEEGAEWRTQGRQTDEQVCHSVTIRRLITNNTNNTSKTSIYLLLRNIIHRFFKSILSSPIHMQAECNYFWNDWVLFCFSKN